MEKLKPLSVPGQTPDYIGALRGCSPGLVQVGDIVYRGLPNKDGAVAWSFLYHIQVNQNVQISSCS